MSNRRASTAAATTPSSVSSAGIEMPRQRFLHATRSDGLAQIKNGSSLDTNIPSADQLQQKKQGEVWVWYEEVLPNNPKHLDWRKKLAGLLIMRIHDILTQKGQTWEEPDPEEYVLSALPDNYRLFEHCRQKYLNNPGGGGNRDRRDMYLYGHPDGRKKRFRSPGEFLPHLEWLATDDTRDPANCRCKLCTSDEMVRAGMELAKMMEEDFGVEPNFAKEHEPAKVSAAAKPASKKKEKAAAKEKAKAAASAPAASSAGVVTAPTVPSQAGIAPSPLPPAHHTVQAADLQSGGPFFRIGEVVWYMQPKIMSLALGAILFRETVASQGTRQYLIQPLSAPNKPQDQVHVGEDRLYPWLAFSTPAPNNEELKDTKSTFDTVDWSQLPQDENLVVDGSIFAALAIDNTYTVVQQLTDPAAQTMEFEYNGIYLGGELIWVGDAVRYQANLAKERAEGEILVVHKIVIRMHTGSKPAEQWLVGDVYARSESSGAPEPPSANLPTRIRQDLQIIQNLQKNVGRRMVNLTYKHGQVRVPLNHIFGRVYESKMLMQVVRPDIFPEAMESGNIPAAGTFLNARGAQTKLPPGSPGVKYNQRVEAFTKSVPKQTLLQINFEEAVSANPPQPQQTFHLQQTQQATPSDSASGHSGMNFMQSEQNYGTAPSTDQMLDNDFIHMDQMDENGYGTMF